MYNTVNTGYSFKIFWQAKQKFFKYIDYNLLFAQKAEIDHSRINSIERFTLQGFEPSQL